MPKKDVSTSCNDLCLDSSLCNQVYVEKVVVDTCTQEVAMENEQLKKEVARLTNDLTVYVYCRDRQKTLSKKGMKTQEKTMNKHYKALSHCWMEKWRLSLILKRCAVTSFLKADFQEPRLGILPSKIRAFLSFQIHQAPIIKTSVKNG